VATGLRAGRAARSAAEARTGATPPHRPARRPGLGKSGTSRRPPELIACALLGSVSGIASMRTTVGFALALLLVVLRAGADDAGPAFDVEANARLLVIAPHPDDETLGAGGLIERVRAKGGTVRVVLITAGDGFLEAVAHETGQPRPLPASFIAYGQHRLREARAALRVIDRDARFEVLGFPDGGLTELLQAHWWRSRPERSRFTGASDPPYDDTALEPDLPYDGDDLRAELERIMHHTRPTIVALPDPLDRHPDHRAAGLFTLLAIADWSAAHPTAPRPQLLAYLVHWPDWPPGWDAHEPQARPDQRLELPPAAAHAGGLQVSLVLTDQEIAAKLAALEKYRTQMAIMAPFLTAFVRRTEPFTVLDFAETGRVADAIERAVTPLPHRHPSPPPRHGPSRR